jgi:hypothetical protein
VQDVTLAYAQPPNPVGLTDREAHILQPTTADPAHVVPDDRDPRAWRLFVVGKAPGWDIWGDDSQLIEWLRDPEWGFRLDPEG